MLIKAKIIMRACFITFFIVAVLTSFGCCRKKVSIATRQADKFREEIKKEESSKKNKSEPVQIVRGTGLNFSIAPTERAKPINEIKVGMSFFEEHYVKGINAMQKGEYEEAITIFKEIVEKYPGSEEASVSELCLADMYFDMQDDKKALELYKKIVKEYPNSRAAINAKAAIKYLETFNKHEKSFIPVDKYDRGERRR